MLFMWPLFHTPTFPFFQFKERYLIHDFSKAPTFQDLPRIHQSIVGACVEAGNAGRLGSQARVLQVLDATRADLHYIKQSININSPIHGELARGAFSFRTDDPTVEETR
jgi:hypothetical protein